MTFPPKSFPPLALALVAAACGSERPPLPSPEVVDVGFDVSADVDAAYRATRAELERALESPDPLAGLRWFSPEMVDERAYITDARSSGYLVSVDFAPVVPLGDGYLARLQIYALLSSPDEELEPPSNPTEPRWVWVEPSPDGPWTIYPGPPEPLATSGLVTRVDGEVAVDPETRAAEVHVVLHLDPPVARTVVFDFVHDLDVMTEIDELSQDGKPLRHTHVRDKLFVELAELTGAPVELVLRYRLTPSDADVDVDELVSRGPWIPRRPGSEPEWNVKRTER